MDGKDVLELWHQMEDLNKRLRRALHSDAGVKPDEARREIDAKREYVYWLASELESVYERLDINKR